MSRWDAPWISPTGSAPERPPGEPTPALLALVTLAVYLGATVVGGTLVDVAGSSPGSAAATSGVFAVIAGAVGYLAFSRQTPLMRWVADLALSLAAFGASGVGGWTALANGASSSDCFLSAAVVGLPIALVLYSAHRRIWLQTSVAVLAAQLAITADTSTRTTQGAALLVVAALLAVAAASGLAAPVRGANANAALVGALGAQLLLSGNRATGAVAATVILALVVVGVLKSNRSLLPIALIAGTVLLPQVLEPVFGGGRAFLLSLTMVAAGVAWLATDLARRAVRQVQIGGVFATCLVLLVIAQTFSGLPQHGRFLFAVLHAAGDVAFFAAAAAARRRPATVISGLCVASSVPAALAEPFGGAYGVRAVMGLVTLVGALFAARWIDSRVPRPAAAPYQQEIALSGEGRDWTVARAYPAVFDAVVAVLAAGGAALQVVDRAAGRIVAGEVTVTTLTIAIWADDPVQTRLRGVGQIADVTRLQDELAARLNSMALPH